MRVLRVTARWIGAAGLGVLLVAALLVGPQLITSGVAKPGGFVIPRGTGQPPTFDTVLRLRDELALAAATDPDFPIDPAQAALVATSPQKYTPLGRVSIPAVGLDAAYAAGVHPAVLERGPGHWPGTATPGRPGNAVLSGHRTTHTRPFADLDDLAPGDPVVVTRTGAGPVTYRVTETLVVPEADYRDVVLQAPTDPAARHLTLFACHPQGERTHRIVVRATADTTATGMGR